MLGKGGEAFSLNANRIAQRVVGRTLQWALKLDASLLLSFFMHIFIHFCTEDVVMMVNPAPKGPSERA